MWCVQVLPELLLSVLVVLRVLRPVLQVSSFQSVHPAQQVRTLIVLRLFKTLWMCQAYMSDILQSWC